MGFHVTSLIMNVELLTCEYYFFTITPSLWFVQLQDKVKVGISHPVQQPGSYWHRPSAFATCTEGLNPHEDGNLRSDDKLQESTLGIFSIPDH